MNRRDFMKRMAAAGLAVASTRTIFDLYFEPKPVDSDALTYAKFKAFLDQLPEQYATSYWPPDPLQRIVMRELSAARS